MVLRAKKRARMCVRAIFYKMLKMTWNVCKKKFETILSILNFCARIDARKYAHARVFWPDIDRTNIDLDHDKYEWEIIFGYEDIIIS